MEMEADLVKVLAAYRINNQQLVRAIQQYKLNLRLSEERFNEANASLLEVRQENKFLRESLRKLTDQLKMITKTMVSVQDRTESIFQQINQNHELAETSELLRQPQAQYVYDRRRLERPSAGDVDTIPEEEHEESVPAVDDPSNAAESVTINEATEQEEEDDVGRETNVSIEPPSPYAHYTSDSSLLQRLHVKSKSNSFDESFETIEPNRVLEVCRRSQERRRLYAGLQETRQSDHTAIDMECDDGADKTASDTTLQATTIKPPDDASVNDTTVFNPDDMLKDASCSTPVVKDPRSTGVQKAESDYRMKFLLDHPQPVVVLQPLTENNLKMHERTIVQNVDHNNTATQRRTSKRTRAKATRSIKNESRRLEEESAQQSRFTVKSEQSSSTENLSDCSYRSGRPRRNAAPMNMREANLHTKLRRE